MLGAILVVSPDRRSFARCFSDALDIADRLSAFNAIGTCSRHAYLETQRTGGQIADRWTTHMGFYTTVTASGQGIPILPRWV